MTSQSSKLRIVFLYSLSALIQNAQENHGLAVPTPSVPGDFADKELTGKRTLGRGLVRLSFLLWPTSPPGDKAGVPWPFGYWLQWVGVEESQG